MSVNNEVPVELCNKVKKLCDDAGVPFLFITEGKSVWCCEKGTHIHDVVKYHKETEA